MRSHEAVRQTADGHRAREHLGWRWGEALDGRAHGLFTSARNGSLDIFYATRASVGAMFGPATIIPFTSGTAPRGYPTVTGDGLTIVYVSPIAGTLMESKRVTTANPFPSAQPIFSGDRDGFPHFVPDGSALYFSRQSMTDPTRLFRSVKNVDYQTPVLVPGLDIGQWVDIAPVVTPDERVIYFGSSRPGATGLIDVFVAHRKTKTDPFGTPVLVSELATPNFDIPTWISPDECELWLMGGLNPAFDAGLNAPTILRALRPK